jgi:hypothetical protein
MKTLNKILLGSLTALILFTGCDPTEEIYQQLDELQEPYNKKIEYLVTSADYNVVGGSVGTYQAFNDTALAMYYVPSFLASKFVALNLKSAAMVTFNYLLPDTVRAWEKVVFGYSLTADDYNSFGGFIATYDYFFNTPGYLAKDYLPNYLPNLYPNAERLDSVAIIYNFNVEGNTVVPYADWYKLDSIGNSIGWIYRRTITEIAEPDIILDEVNYTSMALSTPYFSSTSEAERFIPIWLKINFPYVEKGNKQLIQYAYGTDPTNLSNKAIQYEYNGTDWIKLIAYKIEQRSEQYVYATSGWIFDPTIRFIMEKADYEVLAFNDPIPHPRFADQGYYYGASAYYRNFDMRLLSNHLRVYEWEDKIYDPEIDDPELFEIFNSEGAEAATNELFRRITQEGIIILLENKFPDAQPQVGGVDAHFVVGFETYNDNLSRSYPEAEYRCVEAASGGNPPVFEFIEGPRERQ